MIKLITNSYEAHNLLSELKNVDIACVLAVRMFVDGYGADSDYLQFYIAYNKGLVCSAFIRSNDRLYCLIESVYDKDEIALFLRGFRHLKIFIKEEFAYLIDFKNSSDYSIMVKEGNCQKESSKNIISLESSEFTNIITERNQKDERIKFLLFNSYLKRHNKLNNFALDFFGIKSVCSLYSFDKNLYLCNVYTKNLARGKGFAKELVTSLNFNGLNCHLVCTESLASLYEKCGFMVYSKWIEICN